MYNSTFCHFLHLTLKHLLLDWPILAHVLLLTCSVKNNCALDSFQHGLVERQILELLHGLHQTRAHRMENYASAASGTLSQPVMDQEAGSICRKIIQAQDVCPICQEELLEKQHPVSYCRCVDDFDSGLVWVGVSDYYCFSKIMFWDDVRCSWTFAALLPRAWPHIALWVTQLDIQLLTYGAFGGNIFSAVIKSGSNLDKRGHFIFRYKEMMHSYALSAAIFVFHRFGCGNNVHISCMEVWADHQKLSGSEDMVKCPLCREDFISWKLLQVQVKNAARLFTAAEREKPDRHLGVFCHSCRNCPVTGTCFK